MSRLSEIGFRAISRQFYYTPYRSGNLARSIGDMGGSGNQIEYKPFNVLTKADYGYMLNEQETINIRTISNGKSTLKAYPNRHYRWFDNFVETEATQIDIENNTIRG